MLDTHPLPRKAVFGTIVSALLVAGSFIAPRESDFGLPTNLVNYFLLALTLPVYFWLGGQFFKRAWASLKLGQFTPDTVVAVMTSAALIYSAAATFIANSSAVHSYYYIIGLVLTTLVAAEYFQGVTEKHQPIPNSRTASHHDQSQRVVSYLSLGVLIVASLAALGWGFWGSQPNPALAFRIFLSVLIMACPWALALAAPSGLRAGMAEGMRLGVIYTGTRQLERAAAVDYIVFDRAGVLTVGQPKLSDILPNPQTSFTENLLLQTVASAEAACDHPLARAIVEEARFRKLVLTSSQQFNFSPHRGISAKIGGKLVQVGNLNFFQVETIKIDRLKDAAGEFMDQGKTVLYVAVEREFVGLLIISDALRSEAKTVVRKLHKSGITVAVATGDHARTALSLARDLGIERVWSEISPQGKIQKINRLQDSGRTVAIVGPHELLIPGSLDIIFPGAESSGAAIRVKSKNLSSVVAVIVLARKTLAITRGNLLWSLVYTIAALAISAGAFYPGYDFLPSPIFATVLAGLSVVIVVLNTRRIYHLKI